MALAMTKRLRAPILTLFAAALVFATLPTQAYFSVVDTGEIVAPDTYQVTLEPQLILNKFDGLNVIGRFDSGLSEVSAVRGILGFGEVDFQIGGFYKYVPFPDVDNQPALGAEAGIVFARVDGKTELSLRFMPLASKRFELEVGDVIPYVSLPFGITSRSDETIVPLQLALGSELRPINTPNISYFGEIGLNLSNSFSYISAAVAYRWDASAPNQ